MLRVSKSLFFVEVRDDDSGAVIIDLKHRNTKKGVQLIFGLPHPETITFATESPVYDKDTGELLSDTVESNSGITASPEKLVELVEWATTPVEPIE